ASEKIGPRQTVPGTEVRRHELRRPLELLLRHREIQREDSEHSQAEPRAAVLRLELGDAPELDERRIGIEFRRGNRGAGGETVDGVRVVRERDARELRGLRDLLDVAVRKSARA